MPGNPGSSWTIRGGEKGRYFPRIWQQRIAPERLEPIDQGAVGRGTEVRHPYHAGQQWMLHSSEKGGKSRETVRHERQELISACIDADALSDAPKDVPFFQSSLKNQRRLSGKGVYICRMRKRCLKDIGLTLFYSPRSFRVTTITYLLEPGVPLEDVHRRIQGNHDDHGAHDGGRRRP